MAMKIDIFGVKSGYGSSHIFRVKSGYNVYSENWLYECIYYGENWL